MPEKSVIEQIKHYQRDIVKCPDDAKRMIRCIERLTVLPVTIEHLQETGVGRSVNELRKCGGEVGAAANALVCKWKSMVKEEEEENTTPPRSDVEEPQEEYEPTTSVNHRSKSPPRNESHHKHKKVHNSEESKRSASSHSSSRKSEPSHSESKSSKSSEQKHSSKSDHRTHKDKSSRVEHSSSSESKYSSSHRSKSDHDSKSHKKAHSSRESETECNGSVKSEKLDSKPKGDHKKSSKSSSVPSSSEHKNRDVKPKYDKEKHRKEESSHKYSSSKKYDIKRIASDSSDDETVYKPSSRKRKKSDSDGETIYKIESKKTYCKESSKKRSNDTSEESDDKSESDNMSADSYGHEHSPESPDNSESEEMSIKSDVKHDVSEPNSEGDSVDESEDDEETPSERDDESDENDHSPERVEYVPTKIKREKESPPRYSKSHSSEKGKSSHDKSSHNSSSHSKSQKTSSVTIKKEKFEDVKVKKEKTEKEAVNTQRRKEDKSSTDKKHHKSSNSHSESLNKKSDQSDKKVKVKIEKAEDGSIDCESGASFGDALLGLSEQKKKPVKRKPGTPTMEKSPRPAEKSSSKSVVKPGLLVKTEPRSSSSRSQYKEPSLLSKDIKLEPLDVDLNATLPEISPNYKPLPHYSPPDSPASKRSKLLSQEEALSTIMSTKNQRTKVYSGNKAAFTKVPSLFDLCTQILRENIDALEYTGGVPYDLLKPVLDRATADQLYQLEHYNPYLIEDTDGQWQFHCSREFRGKKPEEYETWRELYLRCLDEREKKLQALKANITQSMAKSNPIRQTKLAYVDSVVKPPRNIAKKQMKYGTNKAVKHDLVSKAMVGAASSTPAPKAVPVPAPPAPRATQSNAFPIPNFLKKKKAPLMAKTLQLIKGNRFKR